MSDVMQVPKNELFTIEVSIGEGDLHESTTDHHIRWVRLYFLPDGDKRAVEVASFRCGMQPAREGQDEAALAVVGGPMQCTLSLARPGRLLIWASCSMHGLWERTLRLEFAKGADDVRSRRQGKEHFGNMTM